MKKGRKLLSVLLAFVMIMSAFAATFAASAADAYKPAYTEDVTEQDVADLIGDLNTIINDKLLNGDTIETIYKALPALKSIIHLGNASYATDQAAFYKRTNNERFANLPDGQIVADVVDEETGEVTTPGTFTTFFEANPVVINSEEEFKTELLKIIEMVTKSENLFTTLMFLPLVTTNFDDSAKLGNGVDLVCEALGIVQEDASGNQIKASNALGFNVVVDETPYSAEDVVTYFSNILDALLPNPVNNILELVQTAVQSGNDAKLYQGLSEVINTLSSVVTALSSSLDGLIDITSVQGTIENVATTFNGFPTIGEGEDEHLDLEGTISSLVSSLTDGALAIAFVDNTNVPPTGTGSIIAMPFRHMQLDRLQTAETDADILKTIYDYLYENLVDNTINNSLIVMALDLNVIENALGVTIPAETKTYVKECLRMSNDELAQEAIVAAANAAGRELPVDEEPTTEPTTDANEPTTSTQEPTTSTSGSNSVNQQVNIPKTGRSATAVAGFAAISIAAAAGFLVVSRKKED